jgi:hypothetical protein
MRILLPSSILSRWRHPISLRRSNAGTAAPDPGNAAIAAFFPNPNSEPAPAQRASEPAGSRYHTHRLEADTTALAGASRSDGRGVRTGGTAMLPGLVAGPAVARYAPASLADLVAGY